MVTATATAPPDVLPPAALQSPVQRAIARVGAEAFLASLTTREQAILAYQWSEWARPSQLPPPGDWTTWMIMAGRGWGKTRTAAEWIRARIDAGEARRIALVGRTPADVRDVMIEGESGLLAIFPPAQRPSYEPSKRRVTFHTGALATVYSSENPDQLRGPQHDTAWVDELATFKSGEAFDNLQLGLRLGEPRQIVATTPKPVRNVRELVTDPDTHVTTGTTYENRANLAPAFIRQVIRRYEGTRLGQQELEGLLLDDVPGALWQRAMISYVPHPPDLIRTIVAVDPSVSDGESDRAAECGIVVVGLGVDGYAYVLADWTLRGSPLTWAKKVIEAYHHFECDRIVAEVNNGGALVEFTLRTVDPTIPYRAVRASVGKRPRAEPVSALYEQKPRRVRHVEPFVDLEDQMCSWVPGEGDSPDRVDALVWGVTELMLRRRRRGLRGRVGPRTSGSPR
ncbi:MAG: DNA-packaging protein [Chloroflexi bacterium]|nr:DNA-packaging protein [Chloroflexota bacterium]